jgi:pimeloyl-ACP methyl ester carboxylesterase
MPDSNWKRSTAGDHTFVHLDTGSGPLVVLFHGFPDFPDSWQAIQAALNDAGYRTVVPYLRGYHPDTVVEGRHYRARDMAEDALLLLDALGESRATLVGHDFGASVVYGAAALAPERVEAIVAIGVPHPEVIKPSPKLAWLGRHFVTHKLPGAEARAMRRNRAYLDSLIRRWAPDWSGAERDATFDRVRKRFADPVVMEHAFAYYRDLSLKRDPDLSPPIAARALIVGGEEPDLEAGYLATVNAFEPPADLLLVPGAGHWPHREDEPLFIERLVEFLGDS